MKKALISVAATWLMVGYAGLAHATPWFTQDPRTLPEGKWRMEEHILISDIDSGLANDHGTPLPGGINHATAVTYHSRIRYGATDDLTLFVDIPFVDKRTHSPLGVADHSGFGDLFFLAKYKYAESKDKSHRRAVAAFVKPHTGDYKNLSGLLAPGSGQDNVGALHFWEWTEGKTTWFATGGYVWTDSRDDTGVDPGDVFLFNVAAEHDIGDSQFNFVWEINGQHQGSFGNAAGATIPNTGSTVISLTPGVQFTRLHPKQKRSYTLEAGVQVPVITEGDRPGIPDYTVYVGGFAIF